MRNLLFVISILVSNLVLSQDPRLFDNTWYLEKVIVDGQDHYPPYNADFDMVDMNMDENSLVTTVCNSISRIVLSTSNETIQFGELLVVELDCFLQETFEFEEHYFGIYQPFEQTTQLDYEIIEEGNDQLLLRFTNLEGNQAIFGNYLLNQTDFDNRILVISPNPVRDRLYINSRQSDSFQIEIYDTSGRLVLKTENIENGISLGNLTNGLYNLMIREKNGATLLRRIIKTD